MTRCETSLLLISQSRGTWSMSNKYNIHKWMCKNIQHQNGRTGIVVETFSDGGDILYCKISGADGYFWSSAHFLTIRENTEGKI